MTAIEQASERPVDRPKCQNHIVDMSNRDLQAPASDTVSSAVQGGHIRLDDPYISGCSGSHDASAGQSTDAQNLGHTAATAGAADNTAGNANNIDISKLSLVQLQEFAGEVVTAIENELATLARDSSGSSTYNPLDNYGDSGLNPTSTFSSLDAGTLADSNMPVSSEPNGISIGGDNSGTITINENGNLPIEISGNNSGTIIINEVQPAATSSIGNPGYQGYPVAFNGGLDSGGNAIAAVDSTHPVSTSGNQWNLGALDPLSSQNPLNELNPLNPKNPLNPSNALNELNPLNPQNPLNPSNVLNDLNPLNPKNPLNPSNALNDLNPLSSDSPLNPGNVLNDLNPLDWF